MARHFLGVAGAATLPTPSLLMVDQAVTALIATGAMGAIHGPAGLGKTFAVGQTLTRAAAATHRGLEVVWVEVPSRLTMRLVAATLFIELTGMAARDDGGSAMRALVVVESVFGNTLAIADAIARGLGHGMEVQTVDVAEAPVYLQGIDLMVVGGPTHAFGLTSPSSRRAAAEQADGTGLREWLESLPPGGELAVATFDTRVDHPRVPGSAAAKAGRRLTRRGYRVVADSQSFRVVATRGPLVDGERFRAEAWGTEFAAWFAQDAPGAVTPSEGTSSP